MDVDTDIGVSEAKSQEGRKFFYRLTMGYLIIFCRLMSKPPVICKDFMFINPKT